MSDNDLNNSDQIEYDSEQESIKDHDVVSDTPQDNFNSMTNEQLMEIFRTFTPVELMLETLYVPFL